MATRSGPAQAVILFGPPGSGKGTQAVLLRSCLNQPHISTGDMLRRHIELGDDIGTDVRAIVKAGRLVPDELVDRMVERRIAEPDCEHGFILDGYPRTLEQAETLDGLLKARGIAPVVIHLKVDYNRIISRLAGRRQCPVCGTLYSLATNPPRIENFCDKDGARLIAREDDAEPVVRKRLEEYEIQTRPLLDFFKRSNYPSHDVDGNQDTPDAVAARICDLVQSVAA
jgi:adenylate kinase